MTNPNRDFEKWGESLGPDVEAEVRELAALPGYIVVYATPFEDAIPDLYTDDTAVFDVTANGVTVRYRVGYVKDPADETS